jgi:hypothetical protein
MLQSQLFRSAWQNAILARIQRHASRQQHCSYNAIRSQRGMHQISGDLQPWEARAKLATSVAPWLRWPSMDGTSNVHDPDEHNPAFALFWISRDSRATRSEIAIVPHFPTRFLLYFISC